MRIDTRDVNASFDLAQARQRLAETFGEESEIIDGEFEPQPDSRHNNPELARAKDLRKRAEKLLESGIDAEDSSDLTALLQQSHDAVKARDFAKLADYSEQIGDIVFYLEE